MRPRDVTLRVTALVVCVALLATACGDDGGPADDGSAAVDTGTVDTATVDTESDTGLDTGLDTEGDTESDGGGDGSTTTDASPEPRIDVNPYGDYASEQYGDGANWLCHPDAETDHCDTTLDTTLVEPDGSARVLPHERTVDPDVDCFYVYPTISMDTNANSDLVPGPLEEIYVVRNQAARYSRFCRVYAPIYRQVTLAETLGTLEEGAPRPDIRLAYTDVVDAWKHYLANDNQGRGVMLIGHSQGSNHLATLVRSEIAGTDVESIIVAAHLIGGGPNVPLGTDTPEGFGGIAVCREKSQFGCLVSFASYREGHDFGEPEPTDSQDVCVNPAAVEGGPALLTPYYPTEANPEVVAYLGEPLGPWNDPARIAEITTPFFTTVDLVEAECVTVEDRVFLEIRIRADPDNPQADDVSGDIALLPALGLHFVDTALAQGDLIALGEEQANAWLAENA